MIVFIHSTAHVFMSGRAHVATDDSDDVCRRGAGIAMIAPHSCARQASVS